MDPLLRSALVALLCLVAFTPANLRADVFAAVNVAAPPPRTDLDIAIINASLGRRVTLPAGVNTSAFEVYPSISRDGRRLLFQRFGGTDGTRLLLVDVATGQSADLFTPTEIAADPIGNSTITRDGTLVYTGRRFRQNTAFSIPTFEPRVTRTDVRTFPTGPFPRSSTSGTPRFNAPGMVTDVAVAETTRVLRVVLTGSNLGKLVLNSTSVLEGSRVDYGHPALFTYGGDPNPIAVDFERRFFSPSSNTFGDSNLVSISTQRTKFEEGVPLAFGVPYDTAADESQPASDFGGQYIAFVRHGADGHDRLFVQHLPTGLLNPSGVDLGLVATRGIGSVSLYVKEVIVSSLITSRGDVNATLLDASSIGILVQRILGVTHVRGRKEYELETIGRVPLGSYGAGKVFTHWDFEVGGEPLPPGRYLVTLRAVEGDLVRELGESRELTIPGRR